MSRQNDMRLKLVYATLEHVPQCGWSETAMRMGAQDLELDDSTVWRFFPEGINQVVELWHNDVDKKMLSRLKRFKTNEMRVRDKIALAIKTRLNILLPYKSAVEPTLKYLALPLQTPLGTKLLFKTIDEIWHWAGDASTDYNWYTKRALLAAVYTSTIIFWLNDTSERHSGTFNFLNNRIEDVMKLGKLPKDIMKCGKEFPQRVGEIMKALKP